MQKMDTTRLFDSELKVMEVIWENEPVTAKEIGRILNQTIGWNKNTTYTIIKKLIDKQMVRREEPNFICTSVVRKEEIQHSETRNLIDKLYNGSKKMFFASFLQKEKLSKEEAEFLKNLIEKEENK
jgi:predicted transcriptional regulator